MHRSMNNPVWRPRQQPLTSTRREVMLAFEDRQHGPGWVSRRPGAESVTRAKADDPPGWGNPRISGVNRAVGLSQAMSVAWPNV
jgi:hypothetical protein